MLCGVHVKSGRQHMKKYKERFNGKASAATLAMFPLPSVIHPARSNDEEDMTEEEVDKHQGSVRADSFPKAIEDTTVSKGASTERVVAIVKIDNNFWVCNVSGSSVDHAGWAKFWIKHTGRDRQPRRCQIKDCERDVEATGHMYWRDDPDGKLYNYLIPICAHHNQTKNGYDWNGDQTHWLQCKRGLAVKILENPATAVKAAAKKHNYNLRERKK